MKSSTVKQVKKALRTKEFYAIPSTMYASAKPYYIEVYVNVKRTVKVNYFNEEKACERALVKEEDSNRWTNAGYEFVDCDFNIVEEKDYINYRRRTDVRNTNVKGKSNG